MLDPLTISNSYLIVQFKSLFCLYCLSPFNFPIYTASFLPGVCLELPGRSRESNNHFSCSGPNYFLCRPWLSYRLVLNVLEAISFTISFLFLGLFEKLRPPFWSFYFSCWNFEDRWLVTTTVATSWFVSLIWCGRCWRCKSWISSWFSWFWNINLWNFIKAFLL